MYYESYIKSSISPEHLPPSECPTVTWGSGCSMGPRRQNILIIAESSTGRRCSHPSPGSTLPPGCIPLQLEPPELPLELVWSPPFLGSPGKLRWDSDSFP